MRTLFNFLLVATAVLFIMGCASLEKDWYEVELSQAINDGNVKRVQQLLDNNADVNMIIDEKNLFTPLIASLLDDKPEVTKVLLANGAHVNSQAIGGLTSLMIASSSGQLNVVKMLLDYGADVNIKNNDGNTALTYASKKGHLDIAELLKSVGATE